MFFDLQKLSLAGVLLILGGQLQAMSVQETRHLLTRTGFGASADEIYAYSKLEYEVAVNQILEQVNTSYMVDPPAWLFEPIKNQSKKMKNATQEEKKKLRRARKLKEMELKAWWIAEMSNTNSAFTEKMVLFWHNHFTSSLKKVKQPVLLFKQNQLFRENALGNYKQLTHAISKDPAMLGYLDNFKSSKKSPNENFARELLELFSLGEGNYSEKDIKEAARAFTGWSIDRNTGEYKFRKGRHDYGEKVFLGEKGNFDGYDVIEIIFQQPKVEELLVKKLWLEFVSETPEQDEIDRLAKIFRANEFEMKPLMRELLLSKSFRSRSNYARLIKSPIDYIVGTLHTLGVPVEDGRGVAFASAQLGQNLFDPPNVKGWAGGKDWITSSSLLSRQQLLERMFRGNAAETNAPEKVLDRRMKMQKMLKRGMQKVDLRPYLERFSKQLSRQQIIEVMLADAPVDSSLMGQDANSLTVDELISLMSDPVYQLK